MPDSFNDENDKPSMPPWAIIVINIILLSCYLAFVMGYDYPDSLGAFFLICHFIFCLISAMVSKRTAWWISTCIVAFPLISILLSLSGLR